MDRYKITRSLIGPVAAELGEGWAADLSDKTDEGVYLLGPQLERLHLVVRSKGLRITGTFPRVSRGLRFWDVLKPINVSCNRGPHVIAQEITRRLLPHYRALLARVHEVIAEQAEQARQKEAVVERLLRAYPGSSRSGTGITVGTSWRPGTWVRIVPSADGNGVAAMEFTSISTEQALKMADILFGGND